MSSPVPHARQSAATLADLWAIQESLLQAHRTIFITVESIIFAVASAVFALGEGWAVLPLLLLGLVLLVPWILVVRARARAITFIHWMLEKYESGEVIDQPYSRFREFQSTRTYHGRDVLKDGAFVRLRNSTTRKRLDVQLPLVFVVMWLILLLFKVIPLV